MDSNVWEDDVELSSSSEGNEQSSGPGSSGPRGSILSANSTRSSAPAPLPPIRRPRRVRPRVLARRRLPFSIQNDHRLADRLLISAYGQRNCRDMRGSALPSVQDTVDVMNYVDTLISSQRIFEQDRRVAELGLLLLGPTRAALANGFGDEEERPISMEERGIITAVARDLAGRLDHPHEYIVIYTAIISSAALTRALLDGGNPSAGLIVLDGGNDAGGMNRPPQSTPIRGDVGRRVSRHERPSNDRAGQRSAHLDPTIDLISDSSESSEMTGHDATPIRRNVQRPELKKARREPAAQPSAPQDRTIELSSDGSESSPVGNAISAMRADPNATMLIPETERIGRSPLIHVEVVGPSTSTPMSGIQVPKLQSPFRATGAKGWVRALELNSEILAGKYIPSPCHGQEEDDELRARMIKANEEAIKLIKRRQLRKRKIVSKRPPWNPSTVITKGPQQSSSPTISKDKRNKNGAVVSANGLESQGTSSSPYVPKEKRMKGRRVSELEEFLAHPAFQRLEGIRETSHAYTIQYDEANQYGLRSFGHFGILPREFRSILPGNQLYDVIVDAYGLVMEFCSRMEGGGGRIVPGFDSMHGLIIVPTSVCSVIRIGDRRRVQEEIIKIYEKVSALPSWKYVCFVFHQVLQGGGQHFVLLWGEKSERKLWAYDPIQHGNPQDSFDSMPTLSTDIQKAVSFWNTVLTTTAWTAGNCASNGSPTPNTIRPVPGLPPQGPNECGVMISYSVAILANYPLLNLEDLTSNDSVALRLGIAETLLRYDTLERGRRGGY